MSEGGSSPGSKPPSRPTTPAPEKSNEEGKKEEGKKEGKEKSSPAPPKGGVPRFETAPKRAIDMEKKSDFQASRYLICIKAHVSE